MTQAYPLYWPQGWERTKYPGKSQFKTTLPGAIKNVQDSLRKFSADSGKKMENVVVSSNLTMMDPTPKDTGVAIYFSWDGLSTCLAVDRYTSLEENLQAIHHCIEAERTKLRHGGLNLVRAAFRGYAALPPPTSGNNPYKVLNLSEGCSLEDVEAAYRAMAKIWHPDKLGGSEERMQEISAARDTLKRKLKP